MTAARPRIAVIGAGMAGATCARRLADAGADVHLFDKSRGVGGRMATRRVCWADDAGVEHEAAFDHGAPCFSVHSAAFAKFVHIAVHDRALLPWKPKMADGSFVPLDGFESWVPSPDMPALCRRLTHGLPIQLGHAIDAIAVEPDGWRVQRSGEALGRPFSHVVLAMPPTQAANLLAPLQRDWAQRARQWPMLPCWTLIGVADRSGDPPAWDVAWPVSGPLAWVIRNECKPGRAWSPQQVHWVAHAKTAWSETHLEAPDDGVRAALLSALDAFLPQAPAWRFSQVHRWRYASVARPDASALEPFWFDPASGLGVCGDFLGGAGVEGAWSSGDALATRIAQACGLAAEPRRHPTQTTT